MTVPIDVAVGVLLQPNGKFLLGQRPNGKPYAGYWEFPGGKFEPGESVWQALQRELQEELDIQIQQGTPWVTQLFVYPHATVRLHFWRVTEWQGTLRGCEGQAFTWCTLAQLPSPVLPATEPVLRWLELPNYYVISNAAELGVNEFLRRLQQRLRHDLLQPSRADRLKFLQLREPSLSSAEFTAFYRAVLDLLDVHRCHAKTNQRLVQLLVNSRHAEQVDLTQADGIHFTARDLLLQSEASKARFNCAWVAASCHNAAELAHAAQIGCDFAVLGAVQATRAHPNQTPLGWDHWQALVKNPPLPVYALGGLQCADLIQAQQHGAHGVALQRAYW